ncbi:MAG TPA: hypothetical protein VKV95_23330 [Terriglobia bacterium]|nr:hypothetical protein [Terriglobia bacterium]
MRKRLLIIAMLALLFCHDALAQLSRMPASKPVPVPAPAHLLEQLMPNTEDTEDRDSRRREDAQAAALSALGIPSKYMHEARLVFEDLDGDGDAEALLTVDVDGADVILVVLKRKGDQWYRLPSPPGLSCWCKYEKWPLDTFVEIRNWSYDFDKPSQPRRLIFVHASGGGTGLYERGVEVFALHGFELRSVFSSTEERRECQLPVINCEQNHVVITIEKDYRKPWALVTHEIRRTINPYKLGLGPDESWWTGLPVAECKAYTWNPEHFKFMPNTAATSVYCVQPQAPESAKSKHP